MEGQRMNYLLDTATWSNSVTFPEVLPEKIRTILANPGEIKGLSSVSLLECAIHHRRGRLEFRGSLRDFFDASFGQDIEVVEITPEIAIATNELPPDFPGDPFDRTIAATARVLNVKLITPDPVIRDAKFCQVEYYLFRPSRLRP
jgi:PIN domain nuclease of toxin-antitoxin system